MGVEVRTQLEKVMIVNTSDAGGGAERVAMTLVDGFEALGTETWLAVGNKQTEHERVVSFPNHAGQRAVRRAIGRSLGLEDFNFPYTHLTPDLAGPRPDLLLCNNLHGGYFDLRQLAGLSHALPLVLRLADSWTFTGHCAVPLGCERWRHGCGSCPDLTIPPAVTRDATRLNWLRKRRIFARTRLYLVSPSRWLLDRARQSLLAPSIVDARVIPNGVDLEVFTPERPEPGGARRLLFVANGGADNPYKDFSIIRAALGRLEPPVELVAVGGAERTEELGDGRRIEHLPLQTPERLADLYRAADVYVHAAPEESFCLTAAEALACGTPVVAAAAGGIREVVDEGETGFLVAPSDAGALAAALEAVLGDTDLRARMGAQAACAARRRFDRRRMVGDLHAFCAEAAERLGGELVRGK